MYVNLASRKQNQAAFPTAGSSEAILYHASASGDHVVKSASHRIASPDEFLFRDYRFFHLFLIGPNNVSAAVRFQVALELNGLSHD
ncbi:unnamed protein product [Fusarium equiseti]|uniref:Uncharacterized protein n=1 Tax=Fusarium equiseti TaxID=61235 RepID=A0A8J2JAX1_FUSEQ|nr:unnamed protein product [Fusarium equiseti]